MEDGKFAAALARLRQARAEIDKNDEVRMIVESGGEVLARFQPLLQPESVAALAEEAIRPFFYFENNRHWSGLYRQVNRVCADMPELRAMLAILLDETRPIDTRLDAVAGRIKGLGKAILTALLLTAHPQRYGVWNNTSEGGLIALGLMPEFAHGTSFGTRYAMINDVLNRLARELEIDLWTLDALWWLVQLGDGQPSAPAAPLTDLLEKGEVASAQFALERHLHFFLYDNWDATRLGHEWQIYGRPGEPEAGYEFTCGVGRIDILACHRTEPRWLVVELKRDQSSDVVVGQTLRYMGWVKRHLAQPGETVEGVIIALSADARLHYAVDMVEALSFMSYRVDFQLVDAPASDTWERP